MRPQTIFLNAKVFFTDPLNSTVISSLASYETQRTGVARLQMCRFKLLACLIGAGLKTAVSKRRLFDILHLFAHLFDQHLNIYRCLG